MLEQLNHEEAVIAAISPQSNQVQVSRGKSSEVPRE
jgi:hypothetical protein